MVWASFPLCLCGSWSHETPSETETDSRNPGLSLSVKIKEEFIPILDFYEERLCFSVAHPVFLISAFTEGKLTFAELVGLKRTQRTSSAIDALVVSWWTKQLRWRFVAAGTIAVWTRRVSQLPNGLETVAMTSRRGFRRTEIRIGCVFRPQDLSDLEGFWVRIYRSVGKAAESAPNSCGGETQSVFSVKAAGMWQGVFVFPESACLRRNTLRKAGWWESERSFVWMRNLSAWGWLQKPAEGGGRFYFTGNLCSFTLFQEHKNSGQV